MTKKSLLILFFISAAIVILLVIRRAEAETSCSFCRPCTASKPCHIDDVDLVAGVACDHAYHPGARGALGCATVYGMRNGVWTGVSCSTMGSGCCSIPCNVGEDCDPE